jgi:hypothetical protein
MYPNRKCEHFLLSSVKVHRSLIEFNADIKQFGFELNGEKADDNSAWLKSFKQLN